MQPIASSLAQTSGIELIDRAAEHGNRRALIHEGSSISYGELLRLSRQAAALLLAGRSDLEEARVAFLVEPAQMGSQAAGPLQNAEPASNRPGPSAKRHG